MADAFAMLGLYDFLPCHDAMTKAKAAAEKALVLDEQSAEAQSSLGAVLGFLDWDGYRAEPHFLRALDVNPNYTPARYWYASNLAAQGRIEDALAQDRRGIEGDPLSVFAHVHLGWLLVGAGRFADALPPLRRGLELNAEFAMGHWLLGRACWFVGARDAALAELVRAVDLSGRLPTFLASLGWALALSGDANQAREIQRELQARKTPAPTRPLFLAILHAALGETDPALAALERALVEREPWLALGNVNRGFGQPELYCLEPNPRLATLAAQAEAVKQALRAAWLAERMRG